MLGTHCEVTWWAAGTETFTYLDLVCDDFLSLVPKFQEYSRVFFFLM